MILFGSYGKKLRSPGHVILMGKHEMHTEFWWRRPLERWIHTLDHKIESDTRNSQQSGQTGTVTRPDVDYCNVKLRITILDKQDTFFFSIGFYSPYRTLAFLNGLLDPQTFGRTPWLGDQSNTRPLPKHRTTQRHADTHPCPE
jgi:hypothetical protein